VNRSNRSLTQRSYSTLCRGDARINST